MPTAVQRIFNFSAGPAVLPLPVLEEAQRDLVSLPGVGMSVLEVSHRSKTFEAILARTEADLRALANVPVELQGAVPAGRRLAAVLDGAAQPAHRWQVGRLHRHRRVGAEGVKEAKRVGAVKIAATTEGEQFSRIPRQDELTLDPEPPTCT